MPIENLQVDIEPKFRRLQVNARRDVLSTVFRRVCLLFYREGV
jgi:hypothetical protein